MDFGMALESLRNGQDTLVPWVASHTDLLARDWEVLA